MVPPEQLLSVNDVVFPLMARSHCMEGGQGTGPGLGLGVGSTVHIAVGPGAGPGAENIMGSSLHVLEIAPFVPCANVLIILQ